MPGSRRPPSKVLEQAQRLARAVKGAKPESAARAAQVKTAQEKAPRSRGGKRGEVAREKIVAALKKLHPMD